MNGTNRGCCGLGPADPKQGLYERLPDSAHDRDDDAPDVRKKDRRTRAVLSYGVSLVLLLVLLVGTLAWHAQCLNLSGLSWLLGPTIHTEKVPTFLSLHNGQDWIYALDYALYDQVQGANLQHARLLKEKSPPRIEVSLSSTVLAHGDALTLTWPAAPPSRGVQPSDVWMLYCGSAADDDETLWQYANLYEAATVADVQQSTLQACREVPEDCPMSSSSTASAWYMPRFPSWHRQESCQFVLYQPRSWGAAWHAVAASPRISTLQAVTRPTALHLTFTQETTSMVVQFVSGGQGTPIVAYAKTAADDHHRMAHTQGSSATYEAADLCQAPANQEGPGKFQSPGLLHTVVLEGLESNTRYTYQAGLQTGQGVTWSDLATFMTAPAMDRHHTEDEKGVYPFAYLVYADQGCPSGGWFEGSAWTAALAAQELTNTETPIRMVHHFGDLSYARGAAHQWDAWFELIEPLSRAVPYHVSVGNHEYDYTAGGNHKDPSPDSNRNDGTGYHPVWGNFGDDSGGECGVPATARFRMPESPGGVFWYSHNFANVHTTVLSSEHDLVPGSLQYEWLVADLDAVNRTATPWVVVEMHRPLYEGEAIWAQNDVGIALRMEIEVVLRDYSVDLVLGGHYHAYHRTCDGLYHGRCGRSHAPMHITVGTAGAHLDEAELYQNDWSAVYIPQVYGYGKITVFNATHLHFAFVQAGKADDPETGRIMDEVWLYRAR